MENRRKVSSMGSPAVGRWSRASADSGKASCSKKWDRLSTRLFSVAARACGWQSLFKSVITNSRVPASEYSSGKTGCHPEPMESEHHSFRSAEKLMSGNEIFNLVQKKLSLPSHSELSASDDNSPDFRHPAVTFSTSLPGPGSHRRIKSQAVGPNGGRGGTQ